MRNLVFYVHGTVHLSNMDHINANEMQLFMFLKYKQRTPMLIPYEQLFIQTYHRNGLLIPEQHIDDTNPHAEC